MSSLNNVRVGPSFYTGTVSETWETTYRSKQASERSWTQAMPEESIELIERAGIGYDDAIIDIGGGSSTLVDVLVSRGYLDITVLDISASAIAESRARVEAMPEASARVDWIISDLRGFSPSRTYALWHDRAVFHFLVDPLDRARYVSRAAQTVRGGGALVIATFSLEGPETCSGLPVMRWSADDLAAQFIVDFEVVEHFVRDHHTPWGSTQSFTWMSMRRRSP